MKRNHLSAPTFFEQSLLGAYSLLLYVLTPFQLLRLWKKGKKLPAYRQRWSERFARFSTLPEAPRIWVHSVSVGETIAAAPLIEALLEEYPKHRIMVTATTPTGSDQVKRLFQDRVDHVYFPYDLPHVVRRFLNKVEPSLLLLMETELWPNVLKQCSARGIPVIVGNARLSSASFEGYAKVKRLLAPVLRNVELVAAQTQVDADRFVALGMPTKQVEVMGNIKSDLTIAADVQTRADEFRQSLGTKRPIWVAASTHQGEEAWVLAAHQQVLAAQEQALLVLVPRHPERFDAVAELCHETGVRYARRSSEQALSALDAVYLGDSMGELLVWYAAADVCFVGGSFVPVGGHNPLEPAALGKPVITGPHVDNFAAVYEQMLHDQAAVSVETPEALAEQVLAWLAQPVEASRCGQAGLQAVASTRGTLQRLVRAVDSWMVKV